MHDRPRPEWHIGNIFRIETMSPDEALARHRKYIGIIRANQAHAPQREQDYLSVISIEQRSGRLRAEREIVVFNRWRKRLPDKKY